MAAACSGSSSGGAIKGAAGNTGEGGTGGDAAADASVAQYCSQACAAERDCDKSLDAKACYSDCKEQLAAASPNLRSDFLVSITACVQDKDCPSLIAHTALDECRDEAVAQLTPSKEGTNFCNDLTTTAEKCMGEFNKADCLNQAKTFTDEAIVAAEECLGKSCSKIGACVEATLGVVGGNDVGSGGSGAGGEPSTGGQPSGGGTPSLGGHPGIGNGNAGEAGAGGALDLTPFTGPCTDGAPRKCVSGTELNDCVSGEYVVAPCSDYLEAAGFTGSECQGQQCVITGYLDETCQAGVLNLCRCEACTSTEEINAYINCYYDDPVGDQAAIYCMAKAVDCVAVNACVNPPM